MGYHDAGQGVFIAESVRSARIPPSTVRTTVLQPGPSLEPAEGECAMLYLLLHLLNAIVQPKVVFLKKGCMPRP